MSEWVATRLAAAQSALISIEGSIKSPFEIHVKEWSMVVVIYCGLFTSLLACWLAKRAAKGAVAGLNAPMNVTVRRAKAWEYQQ